jgi:predicted ATPase/DNA-binding SARP family transcriptional activator
LNGETIPADRWKLRKVRGLVKLLALAPGHRLQRDLLIETLWPEAGPGSGVNAFYQALYNARHIFEGIPEQPTQGMGKPTPFLVLKEGLLVLAPDWTVRVDVEQFEAEASAAHARQDPATYQSALAWYRGDLLPEDLYEDWAAGRRESLRQRCLQLILELAQLYETRKEYPLAIDTFQRLLALENADEEAHAGLMRLYARSGQRGLALRQYQFLREALGELNSEPDPRTVQLVEEIRSGTRVQEVPQSGALTEPLPSVLPPRKLHNLPFRLSTFIGREKEIDQVLKLVRETRLLTLTGAGGVGKTSLAVQAAIYLISAIRAGAAFPDGIWLVDLASLNNPLLVPETCAQRLELSVMAGSSAKDGLLAFLEHKRLLLILDNCEHLVDACARLSDTLLERCPALTILATSREPFGLPGETTFRLPTLAVPAAGPLPPLEALAQVESVQLFIERAGKVAPGFSLTLTNAGSIVKIGRRLDGIPLAIELAAARVRMMTTEQIADRLNDAFHVLTSGSHAVLPRQQTLKATIDWSYNLLTVQERVLLQRLSVFTGGWTMEAAEAVCGDGGKAYTGLEVQVEPEEVLDLLGKLIDKSLVQVETSEAKTRYRLLETIRQYGRERLLEAGSPSAVRNRHLTYYAELTREAERNMHGKGQLEWLERLEEELDNLRTAMEWSRAEKIEKGLQIAADLMWFWHTRGLFFEGMEWAENLLSTEVQGRADTDLAGERALQRGRVLRAFHYHLFFVNRLSGEERIEILQESIALLRKAGASALRELGISLFFLLSFQQSLDRPSPERDEMLAIFRQKKEQFYLSEYASARAGVFFSRGEIDQGATILGRSLAIGMEQATTILEEGLAISKEIEDIDGIGNRMYGLGFYAMFAGQYAKAEALAHEAEELFQKNKNLLGETIVKMLRIWLAMVQGNYAEVARLGEVAFSTFRELNYLPGIYEYSFNLLRSAWSEGDYPQVIELVRDISEKYGDNAEVQQDTNFYLGRAALSQNNLSLAAALMKKAIGLGRELNLVEQGYLLLGFTSLFMKQGKAEPAARLLGTLDRIYQATKPSLSPRERSEHDEALATARSRLGKAAFGKAWNAGQAMTLEQAFNDVRADLALE